MEAVIYILKKIIAGCDFYSMSISQQQGVIDLAFFIIYVYDFTGLLFQCQQMLPS